MRGWRMCAGVAWMGLAAAMMAQEGPAKDGKTKLQLCSGLPCVEVMVDKTKLMMAINMGNPSSMVNVDLPRNEGLDLEPYVGRDGQPRSNFKRTEVPSVKTGTIALTNLPVVVADLFTSRSANQMPDVDGILGYDAFKGKLLRLDFKKMTMEVSSAAGPCDGTEKLITFGKGGPLVVTTTGFSVNGKPVVAQVDTLFAGTMVVYRESVEKLGLTTEAVNTKGKPQEHFPFTDGGVEMLKASAKEEFGGKPISGDQPVYFGLPGAHTPEGLFDATVGMGLFSGRVVSFDFAHSCFGMM